MHMIIADIFARNVYSSLRTDIVALQFQGSTSLPGQQENIFLSKNDKFVLQVKAKFREHRS